ncbi:MAG: amino acid adenylation domain-containing protein, partial [Methanobrevibacter sp.]|nr:amino acid adenylation domain-containing protein [Methanobrevibacter sp.]
SGKINISYDESFYSKELIEEFLNAMEVLFDKLTSSEELLKNISICRTLELDEDFEIELANEGVVNRIFENIAIENPDRTILYAEDSELTYNELNRKANRIANGLIKRGVNVEDRVMFMMRRNSDLIAAVLGIVKAGAAFIPIDPNYPKNRINQILEDSDSRFVITSSEIDYDGENRINVDELLKEDDDSNPQIELTPDNLCFLIYTSGSTGKPKGVMITHRGISNYIANVEENVPIFELNHKCNKFISISTVSFIVFLREIFGTILNGLPVVFANDEQAIDPLELVELFKKTDAEGFGSTPTRLLEYLQLEEIQDVVGNCKVIVVGGEGFPPVLFDRLSKYTAADIYNSYGPTEVTIASHYKLIDSPKVTAGWKMLNVVDKVMDIDGNQLPPYVSGEIYVGGAGIARGYLNNSEQTEKVFMQLNGIPYYNTGDLGKKDYDGELYVLGRNDTQIKLRGLRIELSEIEGAIANYENVTLSKVVVKEINSIEHLCAYFTATEDIDMDDLKQYLTDSLPEYMVPSYFTQMDEFPKTPNGKTDFKNLPDPEIDMD